MELFSELWARLGWGGGTIVAAFLLWLVWRCVVACCDTDGDGEISERENVLLRFRKWLRSRR